MSAGHNEQQGYGYRFTVLLLHHFRSTMATLKPDNMQDHFMKNQGYNEPAHRVDARPHASVHIFHIKEPFPNSSFFPFMAYANYSNEPPIKTMFWG